MLLMDEPFSGLDPRLREKMREETLAIPHETRATSIIVTHDAEEAMRMGDRVALMRAGAIVQTGAPPQGAEIGVSIDTGAVLVFEAEKRGAGPLTISWSAACDGGAFTAIVP